MTKYQAGDLQAKCWVSRYFQGRVATERDLSFAAAETERVKKKMLKGQEIRSWISTAAFPLPTHSH